MTNVFKKSFSMMAGGSTTKMIEDKITKILNPRYLKVECESDMHAVPKGVEKHFFVHCVSEVFEGLPNIKCHRIIYDILDDELKLGVIHALRIFARAPSGCTDQLPPPPPKCGGGGHL